MAVRRCNGEGTFITMPNGKIRLRRQYGYNENGNVRFLTVTGKSRKECIRLMEERITELDKKAGVFRGGDTVEELCRKHLNTHISQRGRIKATAADRRESTINNQVAPYPIAHMQASAVRPIDIEGHIERSSQRTAYRYHPSRKHSMCLTVPIDGQSPDRNSVIIHARRSGKGS